MSKATDPAHEPASRRVAAVLRAGIESGDYGPGDRLPSERVLAVEHGVARNTAREAIRQLADSGLVTAHHGKGVFVRDKPRLMRFGQWRYSKKLRDETGVSPFHAEVTAQGMVPNAFLEHLDRVKPPLEVAERLGVSPDNASVIRRENWYFADDEPMQIGVTYIPWEIVKGTELAEGDNLGKGDLYARFSDLGHEITFTREEVTARMPKPDEVIGLSLPDGVPVLVVRHTGLDQHRKAFEVTEFIMRADHSGLDYTMKVDE